MYEAKTVWLGRSTEFLNHSQVLVWNVLQERIWRQLEAVITRNTTVRKLKFALGRKGKPWRASTHLGKEGLIKWIPYRLTGDFYLGTQNKRKVSFWHQMYMNSIVLQESSAWGFQMRGNRRFRNNLEGLRSALNDLGLLWKATHHHSIQKVVAQWHN